MRLIFVRHGHPDYRTDSLTPLGWEQAKCAAERLALEPITQIYCSPFGRALQTAVPTAEKLGLPLRILEYMHEVNWRPIRETEESKQNPQIYHPWLVSHELTKQGVDLLTADYSRMECWTNSTLQYCYARISEGIDSLLLEKGYKRNGNGYTCIRENDETIALFAHHGSGSCLFSHLLNIPLLAMFAGYEYTYAGISVFNFNAKPGEGLVAQLQTFNDHSHIDNCETMLMQ